MRAPLTVLMVLAAAGCGSRAVSYQVAIVGTSCGSDPSQQPFPSSGGFLQITVRGDGITKPVVATYPLGQHSGNLTQIPAGTNRVIEARAYEADQTTLVSVGRSLPFAVPEQVPSPNTPTQVTLFMRRVGVFVSPNLASTPQTCSGLTVARAGHTATLLNDGRVLIAGGFVLDGGSLNDGGEAIALGSTEFYDPTTGAFSSGPVMEVELHDGGAGQTLPRAFHTASLLSSGAVLLVGGEEYRDGVTIPLSGVLFFDPTYSSGGQQPFDGLQLTRPRTHHGAAVDNGGRILLVGGYGSNGQVNDSVEWFDPATWISTVAQVAAGVSLPVTGMGVAPVLGGNKIAVIGGMLGGLDGGLDGGTQAQVTQTITYFTYVNSDGGTFQPSTGPSLQQPVTEAGVAPYVDPTQLFIAGGYNGTAGSLTPSSDSQILLGTSNTVKNGPTLAAARGDICAALLLDGRVLTVGGRTYDGSGFAQSLGTAELITSNSDGTSSPTPLAPLQTPRSAHTCTTLADGSVLILGGLNEVSGQQTVLQDAVIYMPKPTQ